MPPEFPVGSGGGQAATESLLGFFPILILVAWLLQAPPEHPLSLTHLHKDPHLKLCFEVRPKTVSQTRASLSPLLASPPRQFLGTSHEGRVGPASQRASAVPAEHSSTISQLHALGPGL